MGTVVGKGGKRRSERMTEFDFAKWQYLTKKYPERAGLAYELYVKDKKKSANLTTYFMWAGKVERRNEKRYRSGLQKYCNREKVKMEIKNDKKTDSIFI